MSFLSHSGVDHLITTYGYWALAAIVALESMAVPLPGETALIVAALIAATTDSLNIWIVIAVAAFGAIVGDIMGLAEVGMGIAAGIIVITAVIFVRRHEANLQARAERALPGPVIHPHTVGYTKPAPDQFNDF